MRIAFCLALSLAVILFTGCGPKRIDGSSEAAFQKSLQAMSESLNEQERAELSQGVMALSLQGMNLFEIAAAPGGVEAKMRESLNGKTFAEIKAAVAELEVKRAAKEKEDARLAAEREAKEKAARKARIEEEVAELSAKKAKADSDAKILGQFEVSRSRFYFSENRFSNDPVIELTVKNGLPVAVSRVYFKAVLSSPGRSVPWVDAGINYKIPGGLEPGEVATWKLSPNMFGEWGKAPKDRTDLILTVSLINVDGAEKEDLYDARFSEQKQERLAKLQEALAKANF